MSRGLSVGGGEGKGGEPPEAKCCDGANASGSVVAGSNPVGCRGGGSISDVPELEE